MIAQADLGSELSPDRSWDLAGGAAGLAIFYSYLAEATENQAWADRALELLEHAIARAPGQARHCGLYGGYLGVAWAVEHLRGRLFDPENEDTNEVTDQLLAQQLQ